MKPLLFFLTIALLACRQPAGKVNAQQNLNSANQEKETATTNACLAQAEAEKILGQTATLTENSSENKNGITRFGCTYTATATDTKTNKTGNLYYLLEAYKNAEAAEKAYSDILKANENMPGLKELNEMGDQAFFHTDDENFALIISRKKNKMLRIKVNKLTSKTSLDELRNISKAIIASL